MILPNITQHKLGSPWIGPNQVVRQATGHTVGIQRDQQKPIVFGHVDDLNQLRPNGAWMCQPLNHCVLVQWFSDRALKSVMLRLHRLLVCPIGGHGQSPFEPDSRWGSEPTD